MPIASIAGSYECIEPQVSNLFKRETLSGDFVQVNKYLVRDLKAIGLWTDEIRNKIISCLPAPVAHYDFYIILSGQLHSCECFRQCADLIWLYNHSIYTLIFDGFFEQFRIRNCEVITNHQNFTCPAQALA